MFTKIINLLTKAKEEVEGFEALEEGIKAQISLYRTEQVKRTAIMCLAIGAIAGIVLGAKIWG